MSDNSWRMDALCRQGDPNLWYPANGNRNADTRLAKDWCEACPVIDQCRDYIVKFERGEPADKRFGVWAAMTPRERAELDPSGGVAAA